MARRPFVLALVVLLVPVASQAGVQSRHSGTIVGLAAEARTVTLQEMGPWTGGHRGLVKRSIEVTPSTRIKVAARAPALRHGEWAGEFEESSLTRSDLHPGDYATVVTEMRGGHLVARSITVVRPTAGSSSGTKGRGAQTAHAAR